MSVHNDTNSMLGILLGGFSVAFFTCFLCLPTFEVIVYFSKDDHDDF